MLIIFVRILFGIATFFIVSLLSVVIAKIICSMDQKQSETRFKSVAWFVSTVGFSVFVTLWCVLKGIV